MRQQWRHGWWVLILAAGCATTDQPRAADRAENRLPDAQPAIVVARVDSPAELPSPSDDPFAGQNELSPERLVAEAQSRNPSLAAMVAAWQAAAQRYPQAISLDDPMFGFMVGMPAGYMVEASQKLPWPGKRSLRGAVAQADADTAGFEAGDARLRLAQAAHMALVDYYLVARQLELNAATAKLMRDFRQTSKSQYEVGQVSQQDVLQADVELAELESRRVGLVRDERIAVARINTLVHRRPDAALPPPPKQLPAPAAIDSADALQQQAIQQRQDLAADAARLRSAEAALALICKDYGPDLELVAKYDAFMPEDMRTQVGLNLNVPLRLPRRDAAVMEATAHVQQGRAALADRMDQVRFEVQTGIDQLTAAQQVMQLYHENILPAVDANIQSARANYVAGKLDFLRLLEAYRQLYQQKNMYFQATADYYRHEAELERAIGGPLR